VTASPAALPGPPSPRPARRAALALDASILLAIPLTLTAWFAAWPPGLPPALPAGALAAAVVARARAPMRPRPLRPETLVCLALAVLLRLPALMHPWAWVNRDGAYGAFVAHFLLDGGRPAPIFTEGAHYQGTLKGHLAAVLSLVLRVSDLSWLMVAASTLLHLVFVASTMALARRIGGGPAALAAGLYLALSPRFLTIFSLNCTGQYMDVLALGGLALALLARVLEEDLSGDRARWHYFGIGFLAGAAFWQQPVALSYVAVAVVVLALRCFARRDPWTLLALAGLALGVMPVVLWNAQNDWASLGIVTRQSGTLPGQLRALPLLAGRTVAVSFPILGGLMSRPEADPPGLRPLVSALFPVVFFAYLALRGRDIASSLRRGRTSSSLLPPLHFLAALLLQWLQPAAGAYSRPRYHLPVLAGAAVMLGVVLARLAARSRALAVAALALLLALNVTGSLPRLRQSAEIEAYFRHLVRAVEEKGIRTGYADFTISSPVTMFTGEKVVLSPRLGPTPAHESDRHARLVDNEGPDAYVLRGDEDPERFAAALRSLGVSYRLDTDPVPIFYGFSRRVRLEEVIDFRGPEPGSTEPDEE
jgi:hypothetical protein